MAYAKTVARHLLMQSTMKKLKTVKLGLKTETIRDLSAKELKEVVGGGVVGAQTRNNDTARCTISKV